MSGSAGEYGTEHSPDNRAAPLYSRGKSRPGGAGRRVCHPESEQHRWV